MPGKFGPGTGMFAYRRRCTRCKEQKPLAGSGSGRNGTRWVCRDCRNKNQSQVEKTVTGGQA